MKLTTEQLCKKMEQAYFDATGYAADAASDVGLRFRLLAAELYSLYLYGEYILKQAFPQTAEGSYLDMQATSRGIFRSRAAAAVGNLYFSVEEPAVNDIEIPMGTVCANGETPYIRFVTQVKEVLKAGQTGVAVMTKALDTGAAYNVAVNVVTLMVTPPAGISAVTNPQAFTGGYDGEDDSALRSRLLENMRFCPNGFNRESYASRILTIEDAIDVNVYREEGSTKLTVVVRTKGNNLPPLMREQITELLGECLLTPMELTLSNAFVRQFPLRVVIMPENGYEKNEVLERVRGILTKIFSNLRIGQTFYPAQVETVLSEVEGVAGCLLPDGMTPITPTQKQYLVFSPIEVTADVW